MAAHPWSIQFHHLHQIELVACLTVPIADPPPEHWTTSWALLVTLFGELGPGRFHQRAAGGEHLDHRWSGWRRCSGCSVISSPTHCAGIATRWRVTSGLTDYFSCARHPS